MKDALLELVLGSQRCVDIAKGSSSPARAVMLTLLTCCALCT